MWRRLVADLLSKYEWFINPFVGRRDRLMLLMLNYEFKVAAFRMKKFYNVHYDSGRLIGIFYTNFPGDIFNTELRVCVYHKRDYLGEDFGKEKYCLVYMFTHCQGDEPYKHGSHFKTDWVEFAELVKFLKTSNQMADTRAWIYGIQQTSKKPPVLNPEKVVKS